MTTNVLFLCTHNSAHSVLAEGMFNYCAQRLDKPFRAFSAGSSPSGRANAHALAVLRDIGISPDAFSSKNRDEFTKSDAPRIRIVITVCDNAANEPCLYWPGTPVQGHWGYPDPSTAPEKDRPAAFESTRQAIGYRVLQLVNEPLDRMASDSLRILLKAIGAR
jgi:arsenate reductase (thioredoxin)